jgi:adenylate cyclase
LEFPGDIIGRNGCRIEHFYDFFPRKALLTLVACAGWISPFSGRYRGFSLRTRLSIRPMGYFHSTASRKAAHEISMRLEERIQLVNLIDKSAEAPDADIIQAFLVQQLLEKEGVRFVDIEVRDSDERDLKGTSINRLDLGETASDGLYTMELCGDLGFCAPVMDPNALDRSLRIVRDISFGTGGKTKRLTVRISFDSFLNPIRQMQMWPGSIAALVTSNGQFLASTDKTFSDRKKLGDTGNPLEIDVLREIRNKPFGNVFGQGHPPKLVVAFYKLPSINWYILILSKGSVILEPMVEFRFYYAVSGIAALIMILLLIRITTRSVGQSVSEISTAALKVRRGDYSFKLKVDRSDEIGQLKRSFNSMVDGLRQRDLIEQTFGRYVDKNIAEELMSKPESLRLGGQKRTVTIMMSDLRDFTPMSEKLQPEEVIAILNRYFGRMIGVIEKYKGIIVDFYGDSILVFFNGDDSETQERSMDALRCAFDMQSAFKGFVRENEAQGLPFVAMGIGIHTGEVIVGNIGTESRAKYGIVGAAVNLTDRIQATAPPGGVIISQQTLEQVSNRVVIAKNFTVCLKGVEDQKELFEVGSILG